MAEPGSFLHQDEHQTPPLKIRPVCPHGREPSLSHLIFTAVKRSRLSSSSAVMFNRNAQWAEKGISSELFQSHNFLLSIQASFVDSGRPNMSQMNIYESWRRKWTGTPVPG